MGSNRRQQTINKRNRERAVAEKRALKLQRKQEKREAQRNGEPWPPPEQVPPEQVPPEQAPAEQVSLVEPDGDPAP